MKMKERKKKLYNSELFYFGIGDRDGTDISNSGTWERLKRGGLDSQLWEVGCTCRHLTPELSPF
jgi:hypothetical protein